MAVIAQDHGAKPLHGQPRLVLGDPRDSLCSGVVRPGLWTPTLTNPGLFGSLSI